MRRLLGCGLVILILIGAVFFVRGWNKVPQWGGGTGTIAREVGQRTEGAVNKTESVLRQIAKDPVRFKGQRRTVTGRVRSATKIASNRNMYLLVEGNDRILVIDDKAAPRPYYPRTVSGVVQTIGPNIGGLNYAYLTDVKSGVKVNPPKWDEVQGFFVDKFDRVQEGISNL
jgi:hypothetical protein